MLDNTLFSMMKKQEGCAIVVFLYLLILALMLLTNRIDLFLFSIMVIFIVAMILSVLYAVIEVCRNFTEDKDVAIVVKADQIKVIT